MNVWFTSDTHFGHANIIQLCNRPFKDVREMDQELIARWNKRVEPGDQVYHLGDFALTIHPYRIQEIIGKLQGDIHLIRGNHDRKLDGLSTLFASYQDYLELSLDKKKVCLSHYPFVSWNGSYHGSFMLHGHCHGRLALDSAYKRMDVGVDVHGYAPISWEYVKHRLSEYNFPAAEYVAS